MYRFVVSLLSEENYTLSEPLQHINAWDYYYLNLMIVWPIINAKEAVVFWECMFAVSGWRVVCWFSFARWRNSKVKMDVKVKQMTDEREKHTKTADRTTSIIHRPNFL